MHANLNVMTFFSNFFDHAQHKLRCAVLWVCVVALTACTTPGLWLP